MKNLFVQEKESIEIPYSNTEKTILEIYDQIIRMSEIEIPENKEYRHVIEGTNINIHIRKIGTTYQARIHFFTPYSSLYFNDQEYMLFPSIKIIQRILEFFGKKYPRNKFEQIKENQ